MSENNNQSMGDLFPDLGPEVPIISGVAHDSTESLATVRRVPNEPGMAAKVFTMLAEAGVNVDMIVQASASTGTADISFTVPGTAAAKVQEVLQEKQGELGFQSFDVDPNVGKVAVVGVGMKTHSGLAAKFFNALSDKGVNVLMISTSEIRIAALVPLEQLNDARDRRSERQRTARFGAILDAIDEGIVVYDAQGKVNLITPSAESLLNCAKKEALGEHIRTVMPGVFSPGTLALSTYLDTKTGGSRK